MAYAHSQNAQGLRQSLVDHLKAVSQTAAEFAEPLGARDVVAYLGLWHDLGKFHPDFQRYLQAAEQGKPHCRAPDHKAAGVLLTREQRLGALAVLVQGHHGGLANVHELAAWLDSPARKQTAQTALSLASSTVPNLIPSARPSLPSHVLHDAWNADLFLRLLFSCLVDADFLDTEAHFSPEKTALRGSATSMAELWQRLEKSQASLSGHKTDPVNQVRHEIYQCCVRAAASPPGLFRLTVPTGGGKTRSGMAFALRHASLHGLKRVIVAIPFISITEQTADTYCRIFGPEVVLEHHSGRFAERSDDDVSWDGLAAENWDAPIVVTTTVQLFESLFANTPSAMRKLHRLAESVIIIDEAQSLPPRLLTPILDVLCGLTTHYRTTVVFSTATQPAFSTIPVFRNMQAYDIVPEPQRYFDCLRRVTYDWRTDTAMTWDEVAEVMRVERQALAVVNTKANALALLDALDDRHALHLSTLLCGAHRRHVLAEVRRRLAAGEPCHLVSTQVVEAGVDLDFPVVLRAAGPLDSIIQAAGRCNREGRLEKGRVIVFEPEEGGMPSGAYRTAADIAREFMERADPDDTTTASSYFARLFATVDTDRERIQELRKNLDFPAAAQAFRMIDEDTEEVIVCYGDSTTQEMIKESLECLRKGTGDARRIVRCLQPYMVKMWRKQAERYRRRGLVSPVLDRLGQWFGKYDNVRGVVAANPDPDAYIV